MDKIIVLWASIIFWGAGSAYAVGEYPVPQVTDVTFGAQASYDAGTGRFTYQYRIASGPGNIGTISIFYIDITRKNPTYDPVPTDFSYSNPQGKKPTQDVMDFFLRYANLPHKVTIETIATDLPKYWSSNPTQQGDLAISTPSRGRVDENGVFQPAYRILPGESYSGLTVIGLSPPTLRELVISPDWRLIVENEAAVTDEVRAQADQIIKNKMIRRFTIGPERTQFAGSIAFHNRLVKDIDRMVELGWVNDIAVIDAVKALLAEALVLVKNREGTAAKLKYLEAMDLMAPVTEVQMRREAIDLITIDLQLRLQFVADTPPPPQELEMIIDPEDAELEIGRTVSFLPTLIDRAQDDAIIDTSRMFFTLEVLSGPHAGLVIPETPPLDGVGVTPFSLRYAGVKVGTDIVEIIRPFQDSILEVFKDQLRVKWTGGPDYVISYFSPPFLQYRGDATIFVQDYTKNVGTTPGINPSVTRYYLSESPNFDLANAFQLTEREVLPLDVGLESSSGATELVWPSQFPAGTYYFAACVDAENQIAELNENNNCSFHQVDKVAYKVALFGEEPFEVNAPPNCDQAVAFPDSLWPPNHKFESVAIEGVTDVDQDAVVINITGITQDEPVIGESSGYTSPDAAGVGASSALLRSERDGTGDGRVYAIHFNATDSAGNECSGTVTASSVVHDQSNRSLPPIDSGQIYDSTLQY